jgi:hypothetical protein
MERFVFSKDGPIPDDLVEGRLSEVEKDGCVCVCTEVTWKNIETSNIQHPTSNIYGGNGAVSKIGRWIMRSVKAQANSAWGGRKSGYPAQRALATWAKLSWKGWTGSRADWASELHALLRRD